MDNKKRSTVETNEPKKQNEQEKHAAKTQETIGSTESLISQNTDSPSPPSGGVGLGDLLNFTTAILALVGAAILYIVGWVYEAYWYGFFGINLSQISIVPSQTMVESAPAVLIIFSTILVTIFAYNLYLSLGDGNKTSNLNTQLTNAPIVMLIGAGLSVLVVIVFIIIKWKNIQPLPIEIGVSTIALIAIVGFMFIVVLISNPKSTIRLFFALGASSINIQMLSGLAGLSTENILIDWIESNETLNNFFRKMKSKGEVISTLLRNAWRLWIGFIIVFFLLITVTLAAIFGRADAHFIKRPMLGSWQANEIYIYSGANEKLPLKLSSAEFAKQGYEYGPFALIANDDQVYYLAEWKTDRYYPIRPNVYVVPRSNDSAMIVLYEPQPTSVPLPSPTVTARPVVTSTPTPTPTSPITQTP